MGKRGLESQREHWEHWGDWGACEVPMVGSCHSQVRGAGGHWGHWEGLGGARRAGSTGLPGSSQWGQVRVGMGQQGATLHPQAPLTVMGLGLGLGSPRSPWPWGPLTLPCWS